MRVIYFLLLAILLLSFWKVIAELRRRDKVLTPILGWIVGLGFFMLAPLSLMVLNNGYEFPFFYGTNETYAKVDLSNINYFIPFLVIWISLMFSFMAVFLFTPRISGKRGLGEIVLEESKLQRVILITAAFTLLDCLMMVWLAGGLQAFLLSNWYIRGVDLGARLGDRYTFYLWLSIANQTVFAAAAVLYSHSQVRTRNVNWHFSILILLLFIFHIVTVGDRIYFALYLVSLITSCWLYGRKRFIAALVIIAPVLAVVFSAWGYFRNDLTKISENMPTYMEEDFGNRAVTHLMDACDGSDTVMLFHIINDFGQKYDYMYGASYARVFFFMVPRRFYPEKPERFTVQLAKIYEPGVTTSLAATQLGELYANFGPLSVVLLPLITTLILWLSESLTQEIEKRILVSTVVFLLLIWSARATFEDNFINLLFVLLLIWALRLEQGLCFPGRAGEALPLVSS
jgi:hypothetical protein